MRQTQTVKQSLLYGRMFGHTIEPYKVSPDQMSNQTRRNKRRKRMEKLSTLNGGYLLKANLTKEN